MPSSGLRMGQVGHVVCTDCDSTIRCSEKKSDRYLILLSAYGLLDKPAIAVSKPSLLLGASGGLGIHGRRLGIHGTSATLTNSLEFIRYCIF